ncbi:MAG: hypothetical protein ACK56F_26865 [bacterium]
MIYHKEGGYYEGSWKNDQPNGKGRLIYEDGTQYEGYFKDNKCINSGK